MSDRPRRRKRRPSNNASAETKVVQHTAAAQEPKTPRKRRRKPDTTANASADTSARTRPDTSAAQHRPRVPQPGRSKLLTQLGAAQHVGLSVRAFLARVGSGDLPAPTCRVGPQQSPRWDTHSLDANRRRRVGKMHEHARAAATAGG